MDSIALNSMDTLMIVESPAKARKIQKFVPKNFRVLSSYGHIMNLPRKEMGIDPDNDFKMTYIIMSDKRKTVNELKQVGKGKRILLAADSDREGDAIAWHCGRLFKTDFEENNRITFNEISQKAILKSIEKVHQLDMNSVNSQKARQCIDKLMGYELSPLLWRHIKTKESGLSAGRVQSTLLEILKQHEDNINEYEPEYIYDCIGSFTDDQSNEIESEFIFGDDLEEVNMKEIFECFNEDRRFNVVSTKKSTEKRYPPTPLITSTLQQSAQNEFGFPVSMTMSIAQKLYENGKITYMRTDSTFMSEDFVRTLKNNITENYGKEYYRIPQKKKVKGAQEAHECIRPTDLNTILSDKYEECDKKLYNMILKKTVQSHMKPALYDVTKISLMNDTSQKYGSFLTTHKTLDFLGFLAYDPKNVVQEKIVKEFLSCDLREAVCKEKESNTPTHYTESAIVKKLESSGVGRPSTYASTIDTIMKRKYAVAKTIKESTKEEECTTLDVNGQITEETRQIKVPEQKKRILLTDLGEEVHKYLKEQFDTIITPGFTAGVESDLDMIARGDVEWLSIVRKVYDLFHPIVMEQMKHKIISKGSILVGGIEIKSGKYGPYISHNGRNIGLTNYLEYQKKKLDELTDTDMKCIIDYPMNVGTYQKKDIIIQIGPYGKYMKYDGKNIRIEQKDKYTKEECIKLIQ